MATATPKTIVAFGELLWDIFPTGEVLGGAPANFAYRANSLGNRVHIVTRIGRDERGERAAELLKAKGMSLDYIQWDEQHPTGTVPITLKSDGSPDFQILPDVAFDYIELRPELLARVASADAICFGTLIQRNTVSRRTLYELLNSTRIPRKVLDLNLRKDCHSPETIQNSLMHADILKLNEQEAAHLAATYDLPVADFARAAVERWRFECCVVTRGADGVVAASRDGQFAEIAAAKMIEPVVDTCGCGDAFTAMFLHRFLEGASLEECCEAGNEIGARVARQRGGMEPLE